MPRKSETVTSRTTGPGISDHDHVMIVCANIRAKQNAKKPCFIHLFRTLALLDLVDKLTTSIENNEITIGIFVDLAKAFDTLNV